MSKLHLLGVRFKNYRNFKDVIVNLSSKYKIDSLDDTIEEINKGTYLHYKRLIVNVLKITELEAKNDSNISYKCIVGKNGTGKTTLLEYQLDRIYNDITAIESVEKIAYRIYLDEENEVVYISHNYEKDNDGCLGGERLTTVKNAKCELNGDEIPIEVADYDNNTFDDLVEIKYADGEIQRYRRTANDYTKTDYIRPSFILAEKELLSVLDINSENIAFTFKKFTSAKIEFSDINKDELKDIISGVKELIKQLEQNYTLSNLEKLVALYLYCSKPNKGKLDFERVTLNDFIEEQDILKEFQEIIKGFYNLSEIQNNKLLYCEKASVIQLGITRETTFKEINYKFFVNYKNKNDENYKKVYTYFEELHNFLNKYKDYRGIDFKEVFSCKLDNSSSGERHTIGLLAKIYDVINDRLVKISKDTNVKTTNILLTIDEPDIHMHPEWARKFKYLLHNMLEKFKDECSEKKLDVYFQVIITTHSPFIVSDFKKNELLKLSLKDDDDIEYTEVEENNISTFGANIYDIMDDAFFLDSAIGEFAKKEIEEVVRLLKRKDIQNEDLEKCKQLKDEIGDVFIKDYLVSLIYMCEVNRQ